MKKITLIFALLMSASALVMAQPQLSWRFANYQVINAGAQLQFDVEVKADIAGSFHRDLQIYFDYNTTAFGSDIVSSGNISYSPLELMDDPLKYSVVNTADNTSSKFAIITEAEKEMDELGSTTWYEEITTDYQGVLRFTIDIATGQNEQMCGIAFDQTLMNGGQYYQSTSLPVAPFKYDELAYEGDISAMKLSTMYGLITYGESGLPVHSCTVTLKQGPTTIATAVTDASGNYYFSDVDNGAYTIETSCSLPHGGMTSQDLDMLKNFLNFVPGVTFSPLQVLAGDMNWDGPGSVTSQDLDLMKNVLNFVPGAVIIAPDWVFEVQTTSVLVGIGNQNYQGLCAGDVNQDYTGF